LKQSWLVAGLWDFQMGTRVNVLFEHLIPNHRDRSAVLARLAATTPAALAILDYWESEFPEQADDGSREWSAEPEPPRFQDYLPLSYIGPGPLFLSTKPKTAVIRTGARWGGFLGIRSLRHVHVRAFRSIAAALGGHRLAIFRDCDNVGELFCEGKGMEECCALMEQQWGPPQPSIQSIDPRLVNWNEPDVPTAWFLEETTP
jgi:hypothetical protein